MFRKFLLGAVAATIAATPMVAADAQTRSVTTVRERHDGTVVTRRTVRSAAPHRGWQRGQQFDRRHAPNYRVIDYRPYRARNLYAPPRGYHWVRSGSDAVLVAIRGGTIRTVVGGVFR